MEYGVVSVQRSYCTEYRIQAMRQIQYCARPLDHSHR